MKEKLQWPAMWYNSVKSLVALLTLHIRAQVQILPVLLLIQLLANITQKAAGNDLSR